VLLNDRLMQVMAIAQRGNTKLGLLYLDIDRFKTINDSWVRDRRSPVAIRRAAIAACVRLADTVKPTGSDEFVILLSQLAKHRMQPLSQRKSRDTERASSN